MRRLLATVFLFLSCAPSTDERPNVVLIVIDTIRADRLGCHGSRTVATPHIDDLASKGVLFEKAFTQATVTLPSVCSILTSCYPYRHQVRANDVNPLHERFVTLAERFHDAGYRSAAILGSTVLESSRNLGRGFDLYDEDFPESVTVYDPRAVQINALGDRSQRRAADVTSRSLRWIEQNSDRPFFLMAHYFDPHSIYDPPPPFDTEYAGRKYDGEIAYTDRELGRLLSRLGESGRRRKTLIVLVGDHGESLGDHGEAEHGFFVYDATTHVPLILSFPGELPGGVRISEPVRSIDVAPTVLELTGMEAMEQIDGRSLVPLTRGDPLGSVPVYSEAFLGYFTYGWSPTRSLRTARWKYVDAPQPELYDLSRDPAETRNLHAEDPATASRFAAMMEEHLSAEKAQERLEFEVSGVGPDQQQRLRALGYLSSGGRTAEAASRELPDPKVEVWAFRDRQMEKQLTYRGHVLLDEARVDEAESTLREAITLRPDSPLARSGLAAIDLIRGDYRGAEKAYRELIPRDSLNYGLRVGLALSLGLRGETDAALSVLDSVAGNAYLDEASADRIAALGRALSRGEPIRVGTPSGAAGALTIPVFLMSWEGHHRAQGAS